MNPLVRSITLAAVLSLLVAAVPSSAQTATDNAGKQPGSAKQDSSLLIPVPDPQTRKFGYIDKAGKVVIPFQFESAGFFHEGLAQVERKNDCGFIDRSGALVIPYRRCYLVDDFHEGFAVLRNKRRGTDRFLDRNGRYLKNAEFAFANSFSEGLADFKPQLEPGCCWGYIDREGHVVIPPRFEDFAGSFSEGLAAVRLQGKAGFIDQHGVFVIAPQFEKAADFREGVAPVRVGGKWGFIDRSGAFVIPPQFYEARSFSEGLASVYLDEDHGGYIDHAGHWVVQPKYKQVYPFDDGYAEVVNGTVGFINREGLEVIPVTYAEGGYLGEGLFHLEFYRDGTLQNVIRDLAGNVIYAFPSRR